MNYGQALNLALLGKDEGYDFLYNETFQKSYYVALKYMKNEEAALDVLQEAYAKAFSSLDQLQDANKFPAWFSSIVASKSLDALRKRNVVLFSQMGDEEREIVDFIEDDRIDVQPELAMDQAETNRIVQEILDGLSDEQRFCIMMYYMDQMSVKEIAQALGVSENTVKSRLNYGRKNIKNKVQDLEKKGTKLMGLAPMAFFAYLLMANTETVRAATKTAVKKVKKGVADTLLDIGADVVKGGTKMVKSAMSDLIDTGTDQLGDRVKGIVNANVKSVTKSVNKLVDANMDKAESLVDSTIEKTTKGVDQVVDSTLDKASASAKDVIHTGLSGAKQTADDVISGGVNTVKSGVKDLSGNLNRTLHTAAGDITGNLNHTLNTSAESITGNLNHTLNASAESITGNLNHTLNASAGSITGNLNHTLNASAGDITGNLNHTLNASMGDVTNNLNGTINNVAGDVTNTVNQAVEANLDGVKETIGQGVDKAKKVAGIAVDLGTSVAKSAIEIGASLYDKIGDKAKDWMSDAAEEEPEDGAEEEPDDGAEEEPEDGAEEEPEDGAEDDSEGDVEDDFEGDAGDDFEDDPSEPDTGKKGGDWFTKTDVKKALTLFAMLVAALGMLLLGGKTLTKFVRGNDREASSESFAKSPLVGTWVLAEGKASATELKFRSDGSVVLGGDKRGNETGAYRAEDGYLSVSGPIGGFFLYYDDFYADYRIKGKTLTLTNVVAEDSSNTLIYKRKN